VDDFLILGFGFWILDFGFVMKSVLHSFNYSIDFLKDQVADVSDLQLVTIPEGATNHPAWTIGHLAVVLEMIGSVVGIPMSLPESWAKRFGRGSGAESELDLYEAKHDALKVLDENRALVIEAVSKLTDDQLNAPFPDPSYRDVFPTVRHALTQVLIGHTAFHVGQVSVWRRAMGLPGIGRSYE
jgi:hypothetical protein